MIDPKNTLLYLHVENENANFYDYQKTVTISLCHLVQKILDGVETQKTYGNVDVPRQADTGDFRETSYLLGTIKLHNSHKDI